MPFHVNQYIRNDNKKNIQTSVSITDVCFKCSFLQIKSSTSESAWKTQNQNL